jgi:glycosyltransferase involved in cell wall biosynthesis
VSAPAFSVVIAAYNEEGYVGAAITSVLRQTREDWEAVVIDDGSTDGTRKVVEGFARRDPRVSLVSRENRGLAPSLNEGVERSRAPYVSLLDADDLWMPRYLEEMGRVLDAAPDAGFAYTDAWWMDAETHRFNRSLAMDPWDPPPEPPSDPLEMLRLVVRHNFIFGLATMRRGALDEVGAFDSSLRSAEDYELWMRLLSRGYRAVQPPGVLAIKRVRKTSMSTDNPTMLGALHEIWSRVAADSSLPEDIRETARGRVRWCERMSAGLSGEDRAGAARLAVRRRLGTVRRWLLGPLEWRRETPAEVRAAFPDLEHL